MADRIVQANEAFSATVDSVPRIVNPGDLYYASDPIVKNREHLFRDVAVLSTLGHGERGRELASVTGSAVEEATAEPGKRRYTRRVREEAPAETPATNSEV